MIDIIIILEVLFFNIALPLLLASLAIWIVTDSRKLSSFRFTSKINEKIKGIQKS